MNLKQKILQKKVLVGIFGLGYIGLPRCIQFSKKGFNIIGFDIDKMKIKKLRSKKSYLTTVKDHQLNLIQENFKVTSDFSLTKKLDVIIFCLPTPLKNNKPDLSPIRNSLKMIKKYLRNEQLFILESTSYPGTTEEEIAEPLKKKFQIGKNFFISFSPERDDPGRNIDATKIPRIISGYTKECKNLSKSLYKHIYSEIVEVDSIRIAEMTKIYENVYRAINIGLVNELKKISYKMKIDFHKVIKAAKTKPYGFSAFYPGPGLGGHCIPIDPFYLTWKAKEFGIQTEFIKLAGKINNSMPDWIINVLKKNLLNNQILKKPKILVLGVSYKKNINDTRESPGLKILNLLINKNYYVEYSDPFVKSLGKYRKYKFSKKKSLRLTKNNLKNFSAAILVTDHDKFNKKLILDNSNLIIDTRNFFKGKNRKVIKA
jgi:UDP-N-acetyl-D-glucosamine dehydrogenase